jgi:hypothetical protein
MIICILDAHSSLFNENLVPNLVELTNAENVRLELGDEVDAQECVEDDGPTSFDADHRAIVEPHGAPHTGVEVREDFMNPGHVLCSFGVDDPPGRVHRFTPPPICANTFYSTRCKAPRGLGAAADLRAEAGKGEGFEV